MGAKYFVAEMLLPPHPFVEVVDFAAFRSVRFVIFLSHSPSLIWQATMKLESQLSCLESGKMSEEQKLAGDELKPGKRSKKVQKGPKRSKTKYKARARQG